MKTRLIVLGALALGLAGCGGTSAPGGGGDGASVVPASVAVYATADTDLSSDQWKTVDGLLNKFPAKNKLLTQLRQAFERDSKVSWENDVKPALGNEVDVAVLNLESGTNAVGLIQPKDEGKFKALVKKLDASDPSSPPTVTEKVNGWTLFADSQQKIDLFKQAADKAKLSDDKTFQDAFTGLDDTALAKVYVNGAQVAQKLKQVLQAAGPGAAGAAGKLGNLRSGAAELVAQDDGVKLAGVIKSSGGKGAGADYKPALLKVVPSGALAFLSFRGGTSASNMTALEGALGQMPQLSPFVQAVRKLIPIFAGENALYVLQGSPIPEVTLLTTPKNANQGTAAIDSLVATLKPFLGPAAVHETQIEGVPARVLDFGRFSIYYGAVSGHVFVSTSQRVVSEIRGGGQKLADDPTFKEAKDAAGLPASTAAIVYINLKDAIPVGESFAQIAGQQLPPDLDANIRHLRTFLVFGSSKKNEARFTAFLEVK